MEKETKTLLKALSSHIRFQDPLRGGYLSIEDCCSTRLNNLIGIKNELERDVKMAQLLGESGPVDNFAVIDMIFNYKQELLDQERAKFENAERKQELTNLLQAKREEELKSKSIEELEKMLQDLEKNN